MEKIFGRITKIGEMRTGMGQNGQWTIIDFTLTNFAVDGSAESVNLVASGSFAQSINNLKDVLRHDETCYDGFFIAEYKPQCRNFRGKDGNEYQITELKLNTMSRVF